MTRPMCRHCGGKIVSRPRGLCWRCYVTPDIRDLYPPEVNAVQRVGFRHSHGGAPVPTDTMPGTPERLAVLIDRAAANQSLWNPADRTGVEGDW